jgi:Fe-S cluster assembly ATP-binding protein
MLELKDYSVNPILTGINIKFDIGRTYIIMGANGVGKSTLLHSIMGRPDLEVNGTLEFNGKDIKELEVEERAKAGMFVGFQSPTSIPGLSNFQFLKQALDTKGKDIKATLDKFKSLTNELNLPEGWDKRNLNTDASGGEKKKNELIQMQMLNTTLAMLDEPDSGLDVDGIKALSKQLNEWRTPDNTLIVVTHYEKLIESLNPDAVIVLKKDHVVGGDKELARQIFAEGFENV